MNELINSGNNSPPKNKGSDPVIGIVISSLFVIIAIKVGVIALISWLWIKYGIPFVWRL